MTCPATGACLTCRMAGLADCPFRQTCGPNLPLTFGELPKVTVKRVWPNRLYWSNASDPTDWSPK